MKTITLLFSLVLMLMGCAQSSGTSPSPTPSPTPRSAQYLYVLNSADDTLQQLGIGKNGDLSPLAIPVVATGAYPKAMAMDKTQKFMYVSNAADGSISHYRIGGDGSLSAISTIATGGFSEGVTVSPNNQFLYSLNLTSDSINQYAIAFDGTLSLTQTTPHAEGPITMAFTAAGKFAYVVNYYDSSISQFSVGNDGSLAALTPARVASAGCPSGPLNVRKASGGGEYVYVLSCSTDEVEVFAIGSDGTLSSQQVAHMGISPQGMAFSESHLYVANAGDATISMFSVLANGNLQALSTPTVVAGISPETLVIDEGAKLAYVVDYGDNQILKYSIGASGILTLVPGAPVNTGSGPLQIIAR